MGAVWERKERSMGSMGSRRSRRSNVQYPENNLIYKKPNFCSELYWEWNGDKRENILYRRIYWKNSEIPIVQKWKVVLNFR